MGTFFSIVKSAIPHRSELLAWALLFSAYLITAKLGEHFYALGTAPALLWPPFGIALAGLYLKGYRMWSAVALASLVASTSGGFSLAVIVSSTLGNTLQPLIGAWLFRRFNFHPTMSTLRDTFMFLLMVLTLTTIAPTVMIASQHLLGTLAGDPYTIWRILWSGGVLSVLILTPLISCWTLDPSPWRMQMLERFTSFSVLGILMFFLFWTPYTQIGGFSLVYFILIPLFWIGLRFRPRSLALSLFLASSIAFAGIFVTADNPLILGQRLFQTMFFLDIIAIIFYIFASVVEERRSITNELERRIAQLQDALARIHNEDNAKSQFLAVLAHELRNPLAPVLSTLELFKLKRARAKDEVVLLDGAEERLHAMGRLLDDLLDVSRISQKRLKLQMETVEVCGISKRSAETVRHLMDKYEHTLVLDLAKEAVWVHADPLRLEQVVVNLLTNAAKYTEPKGKIRLSCARLGESVMIRVQDNGIGIAPEMLQKIYEPFLQIPSKRGVSGVGVGLSLAKQLIEMHDGTITAYSAGTGLGSTFTITLPIAPAPATAPQKTEPAPKARRKHGRILIIDDNQAGAEALGRLLSFKGYDTKLAFRGTDALQILEREPFSAVLLDIGLPDMDGYDVAREIKRRFPIIRLLALTGYGQDEDIAKSKAAGCDGHLTKPVGFADIEKALEA